MATRKQLAHEHARSIQSYFADAARRGGAPPLSLDGPGTPEIAAWFLGAMAENEDVMLDLITTSFRAHCKDRVDYGSSFGRNDPPYVTDAIKGSDGYRRTVETLKNELALMMTELRGSIPIPSYRNQSHMYWDITMPGAAGYMGALMYNQNNVAAEASPVTTYLEMLVGDDLCEMLGFHLPNATDAAVRPWGHITCDGSVANTESMWAARNLKYYPITVAEAIRNDLPEAKGLSVRLPAGGVGTLVDLDSWSLLNIRVDDTLALSQRICDEYGIDPARVTAALAKYAIQNVGLLEFYARYLPSVREHLPAVLAPATKHYSWPKAAALLGLGQDAFQNVRVDLNCRMDLTHLRQILDDCLARRRPVIQVVAVIGSTEESAVDPLNGIVEMREEFRSRGLEFALHLDAAWGGYFCSILRPDPHRSADAPEVEREHTPSMCMSPYVQDQYRAFAHADSITVDPHKGGFIPYPAGALCYRNSAMRNLVAFTSPVVYHGGVDPTVGVYGVEGSKPGAAAAGVYLSHKIIRPNESGYGKILGKCLWNSKRLYAALVTMAGPDDPFTVTAVQRLPAEKAGKSAAEVQAQIDAIRSRIVPKSNDELLAEMRDDEQLKQLFAELGSDQIIITYSFNFRNDDGSVNTNLDKANSLNTELFRRLSLQRYEGTVYGSVPEQPMFVTQSDFDPTVYGQVFVDSYATRMGVVAAPGMPVTFLISTTQDPWITNLEPGPESPGGNFIPTIIAALRTTVIDVINDLGL